MSTGYLTSSSLIDTVVRDGMIPKTQSTFSPSDFLAIANQEIRIGMLPTILQYHEEFYVRDSADVPLVANISRYAIPYRSIGGKVREIFYKDTNGNLRGMTRISPDHRPYHQQSNFQNRFIYFFVEGNEIVLVPDVSANPNGSLVFSYMIRPNELVDESRVATITGITVSGSTTTYNIDQIPSSLTAFIQNGTTITGFATNALLDLLQRNPGHKTIAFDISPTAIDVINKTITFNTSDVSSGAVKGDIIAFAGECIIPQIPADLHEILAHRVMMRCLQALGDAQGYQIAQGKLSEMNAATGNLIDNRTEGNAKKLNNINSTLRIAKSRQRSSW